MTFTPWAPSFVGGLRLKNYGAAGDGVTDDSVAVQTWLNAVAAQTPNGGNGYADPGTYLIGTTPSLNGANRIRLAGAGQATIFRAKNATQPNLLQFTNCTRIQIASMAFDGNRAGVNQIATQYLTLAGIWMQNCDDITLSRLRIDNAYSSGVMLNGGCTNVAMSRLRLTNSGDNQIYVRAQNLTPFTPCSNVTITNCIATGGSFSGIQGLGSTYLTVTGCVCNSNGPTSAQGDGIGSEGCSYFTFVGNVCASNGIQGIQSRFTSEVGTNQQSSHGLIAGNLCYNHTSSNGDAGGIGVNDTDDITVGPNHCYANYYGLNVNGGFGLGVSHLKVEGGTYRSNLNAGIRLAPGSGSDYKIDGPYVADNGADNLTCSAPVQIRGGSYLRAPASREGIHLATGANNSLIVGAEISNNHDNGVLIDSPVTGTQIRECLFNGSGSDQLRAVQEQAGAGPTAIQNCVILNQQNNLYVLNNASSIGPGPLTAPAVPATTVALANPFPGLATVYITAGASTCAVAIGATTMLTLAAAGTGTVQLPIGQAIKLTYASAPTWTWAGS
jgi:hypothetical protein